MTVEPGGFRERERDAALDGEWRAKVAEARRALRELSPERHRDLLADGRWFVDRVRGNSAFFHDHGVGAARRPELIEDLVVLAAERYASDGEAAAVARVRDELTAQERRHLNQFAGEMAEPGKPWSRPGWEHLRPSQRTAMLTAEYQGTDRAEEDARAAQDRVRELNDRLRTRYPVDDPEKMAQILRDTEDMLKSWPLVRNIDPTRWFPAGDGRAKPVSWLERLVSGEPLSAFWTSELTTGTPDRSGRGWVEEQQGYGPILGRFAGDPATGLHGSHEFAPTAPTETPAYAALASPSQAGGVYAYGAVVLHLSEDVRNRATYTPKDSANDGPGGMPGFTDREHLAGLLAHGHEDNVRFALGEATRFRYDLELAAMLREDGYAAVPHYFEAQVHGGLSLADVDHVVVNWGDLHGLSSKAVTRQEAEQMVRYLTDSVPDSVRVELGREIGRPGAAELAVQNRAYRLYGLDEFTPEHADVVAALDRLAAPAPYPVRPSEEALLDLADRAGITNGSANERLAALFDFAWRTPESLGSVKEFLAAARPLDDPDFRVTLRDITAEDRRFTGKLSAADVEALLSAQENVQDLPYEAETRPTVRTKLSMFSHNQNADDLATATNEIQGEPTPGPSMVILGSAAAGQASAEIGTGEPAAQPGADSSNVPGNDAAPNFDADQESVVAQQESVPSSAADASEAGWVVGRNVDTGEEVHFDPGEVQSWELKDSNGDLIGITFVSDADAREDLQPWTKIGGTADKVNYSSPLREDEVQGMSVEE
ncbi:hypothetical protein [Saccharopolyspora sp. NPDC050642]|uniref:hypothetical protein n=1 Tax=Saccharopolyspora sp. NPDC050642 TaxID=3157099 RepID=UPI0034065085